jgi:hypothetical protein
MDWGVDYASSNPNFIVTLIDWQREKTSYSTDGGQTWHVFPDYPPLFQNGNFPHVSQVPSGDKVHRREKPRANARGFLASACSVMAVYSAARLLRVASFSLSMSAGDS